MQVHVAAAAVAARATAGDQPDRLEHIEMVGEQVRRRSPNALLQLRGDRSETDQLVDDGQTRRVAEGGVQLRSLLEVCFVSYPLSISLSDG